MIFDFFFSYEKQNVSFHGLTGAVRSQSQLILMTLNSHGSHVKQGWMYQSITSE